MEIRVAEEDLERIPALGLGEFDEETQTLEAGFSVTGKEYALRFMVDTIAGLHYYFNCRVFEMTGIKFDNFTTKKDSFTVYEVIITGAFKRPQLASPAPWAVMQLKEDKPNEAACTASLTAAEVKPAP